MDAVSLNLPAVILTKKYWHSPVISSWHVIFVTPQLGLATTTHNGTSLGPPTLFPSHSVGSGRTRQEEDAYAVAGGHPFKA